MDPRNQTNPPPKYITVGNFVKLNPAYLAQQTSKPQTTLAAPEQALTIVSSTEQIMLSNIPISQSTMTTMNTLMSDASYVQQFQASESVAGDEVLDKLSEYFNQYEIPIGLIKKVTELKAYKQLNFIIDDSGSMTKPSDVLCKDAMSEQMQLKLKASHQYYHAKMTRWQEAEDRLHVLIDILTYVPSDINIEFLNTPNPKQAVDGSSIPPNVDPRRQTISLTHRGKTLGAFKKEAHDKITNAFSLSPTGMTPIYNKLDYQFKTSPANTMHYLFTDGLPNEGGDDKDVLALVQTRINPEAHPLTFISCTDATDNSTDWMSDADKQAAFVACIDDFNSERNQVLANQGPIMPFTKGIWLLCQICAAINKHDLDALDEPYPFTKATLDAFMGRILSFQEYYKYYDTHPTCLRESGKYQGLRERFAQEKLLSAHDLLGLDHPIPTQHQYYSNPPNYSQNLSWQSPPQQTWQPQTYQSHYNLGSNTFWQPPHGQNLQQQNNNNQQYSQYPGYQPPRKY